MSKTKVKDSLRNMVLERDGNVCVWCGRTSRLHIDHIIPECAGGETKADNLQVLCETCDVFIKGGKIMTKEQGLLMLREYERLVKRRNLKIDLYGSVDEYNRVMSLLRLIRKDKEDLVCNRISVDMHWGSR